MSHHWLLGVVDVDLDKAMTAMKLSGKITPDDVHKAYKRRVMETKCHPDQNGDEALFKRLTAARDLLLKSFDVKKSTGFGCGRSQGPIGRRRSLVEVDDVIKMLRACATVEEAIDRMERMK